MELSLAVACAEKKSNNSFGCGISDDIFYVLLYFRNMKFTDYFQHTRDRADRMHIKMDWIRKVAENPEVEHIQKDGRIRRWAYIEEVDKYLRVVLLEDNETIHNAFFDRDFIKNK
jgi:hypothetical protein